MLLSWECLSEDQGVVLIHLPQAAHNSEKVIGLPANKFSFIPQWFNIQSPNFLLNGDQSSFQNAFWGLDTWKSYDFIWLFIWEIGPGFEVNQWIQIPKVITLDKSFNFFETKFSLAKWWLYHDVLKTAWIENPRYVINLQAELFRTYSRSRESSGREEKQDSLRWKRFWGNRPTLEVITVCKITFLRDLGWQLPLPGKLFPSIIT